MSAVFVARLICSDSSCAAEVEGEALEAAVLETLVCDCGCALEPLGWPDWVERPADIVDLRARARARDLPDAA
jgi:hypothetical protein